MDVTIEYRFTITAINMTVWIVWPECVTSMRKDHKLLRTRLYQQDVLLLVKS